MPATRLQRARVMLRTMLPWRRLWGDRTVRRKVQGVELFMPWSHVLPDYARIRPWYGQNLVELAAGLDRRRGEADGPFRLLDIGANIGDSALQVLRQVDGAALCVEGDPYWAEYLRMNVGDDARIELEEALLTASEAGWQEVDAVRGLGTTRLVPAQETGQAVPRVTVTELRERHPTFGDVRLVKSDTDGFDAGLIPAVARAWSDSDPVLFFEFDPVMTREVTGEDPHRLWDELEQLGYSELAVWDNTGDPLGRLDISQAPAAAAELEPRPVERGYFFWDVAACRRTDAAALSVFDELVPQPLAPRRAIQADHVA